MLNIFAGDAFSTVSLTQAFLATPYVPNLLGRLGIFEPTPVTTDTVAIERLGETIKLVQTSARGAPPENRANDKRTVRDIRTFRLALTDRIYAQEVANLRAFGSETQLETMQGYAMKRLAKLRQDLEFTKENLRLSCVVGGVVKDADGSTLVDYNSFWGVTAPAAISFALGTNTTNVRAKCDAVIRAIQKEAQGAFVPGARVIGLASDSFFDALTGHPNVEKFYLNRDRADEMMAGLAYSSFTFGNITFINYRGTDDGTTMAIADGDCRFFLAGSPGLFQWVMSPMNENADYMNTLGQDAYVMMVPDRDRQFWMDIDVYSYPLPVCTRPRTLIRGTVA